MGRDRIERDGSQEATQRGRARLMLKLPAVRKQLQHLEEGSPLDGILEAYDAACSALERFRQNLDGGDRLIAEYETVCVEIEIDVLGELSGPSVAPPRR
ncbi:hypothetical protein ATY81_21325 [Rhizobium sp. R72]|nr:hypothetical protein ATY81_21325 [Rhizobium sp. R72]OWW02768.1 hypothetical protein ATY80_21325 [Rhizobium sp. R711]